MNEMMLLMLAGLGAELVLVVLALLGVSWFRNRAARRRDVKAMEALVARVRKGKAERLAALRTFLHERLGLEGEARDQLAAALRHAELTMLKRFVAVYRGRDAATAGRFDNDLYEAIAPYHALSGGAVVAAEPTEPAIFDPTELEALRAENQRLSDELKITMETMSRMLNEYSTMFSGSEPVPVVPIGATIPAAVDSAGDALPPGGSTGAGPETTDDTDIDVVIEAVEERVPEAVAPAAAAQVDDKISESAAQLDAPQTDDRPVAATEAPGGNARGMADTSEAPGQSTAASDEEAGRPAVDSEDSAEPSLNAVSPEAVDNDVVAAVAEPVVVAVVGDEAGSIDADLPADDVGLFDDAPFDKGAGVEAVSELLAAGDTEFVTKAGNGLGDATAEEGLFDRADDDLFDAPADVLPDKAEAPNPAVQAGAAAIDNPDDLFDSDERLTGQPDVRRGDVKQA